MPFSPEPSDWPTLLAGSWTWGATNRVIWLDGTRTDPVFHFRQVDNDPHRLTIDIEFDAAGGVRRTVAGSARVVAGRMVVRQRGKTRTALDRFTVCGADEQGTVVVLRHETLRRRPHGLSVLVRCGSHPEGARAVVAAAADAFGLDSDDFARLSWLHPAPHGSSEI